MPREVASFPPVTASPATRKATVVLRLLGVFVGGLGLYAAFSTISGLIRDVANRQSAGALGFVFDVVLAAFAVWCLVSCYRAWRPAKVWMPSTRVATADGFFIRREVPPVRSVSAILCICLFGVLGPLLERSAPFFSGWTDHTWRSVSTFVTATLACAAYVGLTWWLSSAMAIPAATRRIPQFVILIVCVLLWEAAFSFLEEVPSKEPGRFSPTGVPWGLVVLAVPFAVAILVGKILNRIGMRRAL